MGGNIFSATKDCNVRVQGPAMYGHYAPPNVYDPSPLAPTRATGANFLAADGRRQTMRRPLSGKEALQKIGYGASPEMSYPAAESSELFYEYINAEGEVIEPDGAVAVALWDFGGERDTDLTFSQGDVITVIQRFSNGWWEGEIDGVIGDFPSNFVELEEEEEDDDDEPAYTPAEFPPAAPTSYIQSPMKPIQPSYTPSTGSIPPPVPKKPPIPPKPVAPAPLAEQLQRPTSNSWTIKEGYMTKKGHKRRNWKVRYFVLESGKLSYYKDPADFLAKRRAKGEVLLHVGTNVRIAPEMRRSNTFSVSGGIGLLYITAPTGPEMVDWMEKIKSAAG